MVTALCGRITLSPHPLFNPNPQVSTTIHKNDAVSGEKNTLRRGRCNNRQILMSVSAPTLSKGGGVLDRPVKEKSKPGRDSEFDLRKSRKMSPPYQVMLHNDNFNRREYVVQVLMKVIPGMTVDNAVNIMQEAHINGLAVVIICAQADAEDHCTQLRGNGLMSSIEPASGGGC
ncbi:ATP-dependent Clp protease adapter protein CLPS1, chloroplastic [Linum perenne]